MAVMSDQFRALGIWLDFDNPYQTVKKEYIEAAWWTLAQAEKNGMLERGHRVVNWCPRCETAIADSEVEYDDATDPSIHVKFPVKGADDEYLVIWTTTPWTLPANVAVAAHPGIVYALVAARKEGGEEKLFDQPRRSSRRVLGIEPYRHCHSSYRRQVSSLFEIE